MTKEDILSKHTGAEGIYLTKGMVRGSEALEAMEEYASLKAAEATKERKWTDEDMINSFHAGEYSVMSGEEFAAKDWISTYQPLK